VKRLFASGKLFPRAMFFKARPSPKGMAPSHAVAPFSVAANPSHVCLRFGCRYALYLAGEKAKEQAGLEQGDALERNVVGLSMFRPRTSRGLLGSITPGGFNRHLLGTFFAQALLRA
jgi:hypothetical protein